MICYSAAPLYSSHSDSDSGTAEMEYSPDNAHHSSHHAFAKTCKVCDDKSDGAHFGIESCRACAAFFRRSIVMRKKYICRQGGENCTINKTVRCMCRCCRFNKCLKVGMLREAVQSPRDQIGKRSEQRQQFPETKIKQECADSTCGFYDPYLQEPPSDVYDVMPSFPTFANEEQLMPILKRIETGYNELRARRAQYKYEMPLEPFSAATDLSVPRRITHKHGFRLLDHDNENICHFMRNHFPRLNEFEDCQRRVLYRACFTSYMLFESAYRTYLHGGDQNERWYVSDGNYIDMADIGYYYSAFEGSSLSHADAFKPTFLMFARNVLQPIRMLQLTEIEFFALIALCFYSHGAEGATNETDRRSAEIREAILRELTHYYIRFAGIKDYPIRMSQVLLMLPSIHRITTRFREDVEINKLFNTDFDNDKIYDLINGKPYCQYS